jgi:endonuclease/exonuclease/phosphatase family metal-dependent hydrolase
MGNQLNKAQALVTDPGLHSRLLAEEIKWTQIPAVEIKDNEVPLKILSFNIPLSGSNNWQEDWDYRQNPIAEMPRHYDIDIICYQEPHEPQAKFIASKLPEYEYYGRGRNADGTSEYQPIFWRKNRFALKDKGCFWLSTEPDVPGSQSWDSACVRQTIWVNLFDKLSSRELIIMNTHWDHVGVQARIFSAEVINDKIAELSQKYPEATIILCGDFNEEMDAAGVNLLEMRQIPTTETSHFGGIFTFVGWTNEVQAIIDMIFVRGERIACKQYGVLLDTIGSRKLSDHNPLYSLFVLSK